MGFGTGHVVPHLPFIDFLLRRQHSVSFALRSPDVRTLFEDRAVRYLKSPQVEIRRPAPICFATDSYADILLGVGYDNADSLQKAIGEWLDIFQDAQPDRVVTDHSPTAILAARVLGIPTFNVGVGFCVPPESAPLPRCQFWLPDTEEQYRSRQERERQVLLHVNTVSLKLGGAVYSSLASAVTGDTNLLTTYPRLDQYPSRVDGDYLGIVKSDRGEAFDWPDGDLRVFVYASPSEAVFRTFSDLRSAAVICRSRNWQSADRDGAIAMGVKFVDGPLRLSQIVAGCTFAVTNATHIMTAELLGGGVPVLMLPRNLESTATAVLVASQHAGVIARPDAPEEASSALNQLVQNLSVYRAAATELSHHLPPIDVEQWTERLARELLR